MYFHCSYNVLIFWLFTYITIPHTEAEEYICYPSSLTWQILLAVPVYEIAEVTTNLPPLPPQRAGHTLRGRPETGWLSD